MDGNKILGRQFITLDEVQVVLSISRSQAYALVRTGDLRALRVGGRGQWRVELTELDAYIERCYQVADAATADGIAANWQDHFRAPGSIRKGSSRSRMRTLLNCSIHRRRHQGAAVVGDGVVDAGTKLRAH